MSGISKQAPVYPRPVKGETREQYRTRWNAYQRSLMRAKRNAEYLDILEDEAARRGVSATELKRMILERVSRDNLFKAILDL